jgi:quercetin dioxygenase-like cupin family protein
MNPNTLRIAALAAALALVPLAGAQDKKAPAAPAAAPAPAAMADHKMWASKDLEWKDFPSIKGAKFALLEGPMNEAKPFTARIKIPAGGKIPPHWHDGIEHVTVMSGSFAMGVGEKWDDKAMHALATGDVMIMQPKTRHYAMAKSESVVQVHGMGPWTITYVNPADDPKNQAAAPAAKADAKKEEKKK